MEKRSENKLTILLKFVAIYLIVSGISGMVFPLIDTLVIHSPQYPEYVAKSLTYKISAHSRMYVLNLLYVISGIGLLLRKSWAKKMALVLIAITTVYSVNEGAWGWARGKPSFKDYCIGFALIVPWKVFLFYVVLKWKDSSFLAITTGCSGSAENASASH